MKAEITGIRIKPGFISEGWGSKDTREDGEEERREDTG
jgi:hypothetical protein